MLWHTASSWLELMDTEARLAMPLANRLRSAACVHGYCADALDCRGIADFLLQGPGDLTCTSAPF
eukprot:1156149-Pelagomonas_calceolata.AAC.11